MHVIVIIPALNEAGNIRRLISEIPDLSSMSVTTRVIVVNNGSTDDTAAEAQAAGAQVVDEPRRGYGYACAAGTAAADDADILVFMDGDGSFDPSEMGKLLQPIIEGSADLVTGTRVQFIEPDAMPPQQRFGNNLVTWLMRVLYGLRMSDLGPYRAIRREYLLRLNMHEMTFGWPTEMIVKSARLHGRILEVPVHYRKRWSGQSKVSGTVRGTLLAGYFILGVTLRYALFTPKSTSSDIPKH